MGREELKCNAVVRQNLVDPTRSSDVLQVILPYSRITQPSSDAGLRGRVHMTLSRVALFS